MMIYRKSTYAQWCGGICMEYISDNRNIRPVISFGEGQCLSEVKVMRGLCQCHHLCWLSKCMLDN